MLASPLRELARRYSQGELTKQAYQAKRRELLEALTNGKSRLSYRDTLLKTVIDDGSDGLSPQHKMIAAGVAVAAVAALAAMFLLSGGDEVSEPAGEGTATVGETVQSPGVVLLDSLLANPRWEQADIDAFVGGWNALAPADASTARSNFRYRQLTGRIGNEISQEQALADIGDADAQRRMEMLQGLQNQVSGD